MRLLRTAFALTFATMLTSAAAAEQLRYAIGHPPNSLLVKAGQKYAETVAAESNGDLTVRVFPMSLLSMAETSGGVKDGLADIGALMSPYFPAEYPHTNLIMESSMLLARFGEQAVDRESVAFTGAMSEFVMFDCPECVEEFSAQNQVFTGAGGTPAYTLNCTKPVASASDLSGARLRIGGSNWSRWSEFVDASPVTLSGNEMLEALSQGILDCVILSVPDLLNFGMGESITDITLGAPGGVFGASFAQVNRDTWRRLSPEQRGSLLRASAVGSAEIATSYQQGHVEGLARLAEEGVNIHQAEPEVIEATRRFAEEDVSTMISQYGSRYGVGRSEEILANFETVLEKWVGLAQNVETADDVSQLYWDEIYSRVDVNTYGL